MLVFPPVNVFHFENGINNKYTTYGFILHGFGDSYKSYYGFDANIVDSYYINWKILIIQLIIVSFLFLVYFLATRNRSKIE